MQQKCFYMEIQFAKRHLHDIVIAASLKIRVGPPCSLEYYELELSSMEWFCQNLQYRIYQYKQVSLKIGGTEPLVQHAPYLFSREQIWNCISALKKKKTLTQ